MDYTKTKIEKLFKNKYRMIRYFAYSYLGDMALAENVAQDTFYKLWRNRDKIDFDKDMTNYLMVIARNLCLNILKNNKYRNNYTDYAKQRAVNDFNLAALEDPTSLSLYSTEIMRLYDKALQKMSEAVRETFRLSRGRNLTYNEIAMQLGISAKTVENRMSAALKILREYLKDFLPFLIGYIAL